MDPLHVAERVVRMLYRWHYHLPKWLDWIIFIVGTTSGAVCLLLGATWVTTIPIAFAAGAVIGIVRWERDRHTPALFAVAEFHSPGDPHTGREVQEDVLSALSDHMAATPFVALPIQCVVGRHQEQFASTLLYRVGAFYVVHGSVQRAREGDHLVRARVIYRGKSGPQFHKDPHTREMVTLRERRGVGSLRLTPSASADPTRSIIDEYSYDFSRFELPALVQIFEGDISLATGDPAAAEGYYQAALARLLVKGEAFDHALTRLSRALREQDRDEEALMLLRDRATESSASSELLFELGTAYYRDDGEPDDDERSESVDLLRRVMSDRGSHLSTAAQYNLAQLLTQDVSVLDDEAYRLLRDLVVQGRPHYATAWYVLRELGARHWHRAQHLKEIGDIQHAQVEATASMIWYRRMLRARWRQVGQPLPILYANTADACRAAGKWLWARYFAWRTGRRQAAWWRAAGRARRAGSWLLAAQSYEQVIVGGQAELEANITALNALCLWQTGDDDLSKGAAAAWREVRQLHPEIVRGMAAQVEDDPTFPRGVPSVSDPPSDQGVQDY